jgi:DNA-binding XRE family transcriptional regulator
MSMQTMNKQGIDFAKVEMVRRHMGLTVTNMAKLLGITRVTYYSWVRGASMRSTSVPKVKSCIKQLAGLIQDGSWPPPEIITMTAEQRITRLLELLGQEQ